MPQPRSESPDYSHGNLPWPLISQVTQVCSYQRSGNLSASSIATKEALMGILDPSILALFGIKRPYLCS